MAGAIFVTSGLRTVVSLFHCGSWMLAQIHDHMDWDVFANLDTWIPIPILSSPYQLLSQHRSSGLQAVRMLFDLLISCQSSQVFFCFCEISFLKTRVWSNLYSVCV